MAVAVSAVAAVFTAETVTAAMVLTAVADVGAAMTVVGAVTGSKDLMRAGAVLGVAGGVGSMVNGALSAGADVTASSVGDGAAQSVTNGAADTSTAMTGAEAPAVTDGVTQAVQSANSAAANFGGSPSNFGQGVSVPSATDLSNPLSASMNPTYNVSGTSATSGFQTPSPITPVDQSMATGAPSGMSAADQATAAANGTVGNQTASQLFPPDSSSSISQTSTLADIKTKLGAAWDKLSPLAQAEIVKSALAVPGGIQAQKNKAAELAIQQQKVNQTSYGSQVPTFGIINKARG